MSGDECGSTRDGIILINIPSHVSAGTAKRMSSLIITRFSIFLLISVFRDLNQGIGRAAAFAFAAAGADSVLGIIDIPVTTSEGWFLQKFSEDSFAFTLFLYLCKQI